MPELPENAVPPAVAGADMDMDMAEVTAVVVLAEDLVVVDLTGTVPLPSCIALRCL